MASSAPPPEGVMDRLQSLDAYLAVNSAAPEKSKSPAAQSPVVRAVGARSSEYTIKLHELCQGLGIRQPRFELDGDAFGWRGEAVFEGLLESEHDDEVGATLVLQEMDFAATKKEAKERLCEKAVKELEKLMEGGKLSARTKGRKILGAEKQDLEPQINYVGLVLEFQRSTNSPQPTYNDYMRGTDFACEATLPTFDTPFGSRETYFSSKKAAQQDAARHIAEYYKSRGEWPSTLSTGGGIKKQKKPKPTPAAPSPPPRPTSSTDTDTSAGAPVTDTDADDVTSYAQQVTSLAAELGLNIPTYNVVATDRATTFWTVTCSFRDGGVLEGPLGEARNIFGRRKAREECARLTVEVLLKEREKRLMLAGMIMGGGFGDGEGGGAVAGAGDEDEVEELKTDVCTL